MEYYHTILKKGKFKVIFGDKSDFFDKKCKKYGGNVIKSNIKCAIT